MGLSCSSLGTYLIYAILNCIVQYGACNKRIFHFSVRENRPFVVHSFIGTIVVYLYTGKWYH